MINIKRELENTVLTFNPDNSKLVKIDNFRKNIYIWLNLK